MVYVTCWVGLCMVLLVLLFDIIVWILTLRGWFVCYYVGL